MNEIDKHCDKNVRIVYKAIACFELELSFPFLQLCCYGRLQMFCPNKIQRCQFSTVSLTFNSLSSEIQTNIICTSLSVPCPKFSVHCSYSFSSDSTISSFNLFHSYPNCCARPGKLFLVDKFVVHTKSRFSSCIIMKNLMVLLRSNGVCFCSRVWPLIKSNVNWHCLVHFELGMPNKSSADCGPLIED